MDLGRLRMSSSPQSMISASTTLVESSLANESSKLHSPNEKPPNDYTYEKNIQDAWKTAKETVESKCTPEQRKLFTGAATADDVLTTLRTLETRQKSRLSFRWVKKLTPFLDSVKLYDGAMKTYCNTGVGELALLWGSITLVLDIAGRFVGCFDRFLDTLSLLGENLPRINEYTALFENHKRLRDVLSYIYVDLLNFCVFVVTFFRRKGISMFWRVLWSDMESRTKHIVESIIRHKTLADVEANAVAIMEAKIGREEAIVQHLAFKVRELVKWLAPADVEGTLELLAKTRLPDSGDWFVQGDTVQSWILGKTKVLWIRGIPGCGKSTLCSSLIDQLRSDEVTTQNGPATVGFFCDGSSPTKRSSLAVVKSLLAQIISKFPECVDLAFDSMVQSGQERATSLRQLSELLQTILTCRPNGLSFRIIIDAWDECEDGETTAFLDTLLTLAKEHSSVGLLLSSRNETHIRSKLKYYNSIEVTPSLIQNDLDRYIQVALAQPPLSTLHNNPLQAKITTVLRDKADGQFLWVRLMIDNLRRATHLWNLEDIINSLPKGLERAYGRVLERLLTQDTVRQETAHRLFMLLTSSERPLSMAELSAALCIRDKATTLSALDQFLDFDMFLDEVCGCLVQVVRDGEDREARVNFVHITVKQFLTGPDEVWDFQAKEIAKFRVREQDSHDFLAGICIGQMSYSKLGANEVAKKSTKQLHNEYPFLQYASTQWATHLTKAGPPTQAKLSWILEFLQSQNMKLHLERSAQEKTSTQSLTITQSQLNMWIASSKTNEPEVSELRNCFRTQYERMILECENELGIGHPQTLETMHQFAMLLHYEGRWSDAEPLYRKVLVNRRSLYGIGSLSALDTAYELAIVLRRLGNTEDSKELQTEVLEGRTALLGENDPATLLSEDELGQALKELRLLDESVAMSRQTLTRKIAMFGKNDVRTLRTANLLAAILKDVGIKLREEGSDSAAQETFEECESLCLTCLKGREAIYGPGHPEVCAVTNMLGIVSMLQNKLVESEHWHQQTLEGRIKVFGPHSPPTQQTMRNLIRLLVAQLKTVEAAELQAKLRASLGINGTLLRRASWASYKSLTQA
ncbi:uncharacterized protein ALTATR162_LOCUS135 [Alternaria atra]|uniref:NACHT domain-containing protein n=1 Tax=Alternaria atra TaxID=119953 RepID=A0A8J2N114_9PLEO|nr:uncharacterized protein ALTATR162_LOCUS135 [Alternaria atra]CAG5137499.1 unnamed protein product [Alternaria atra]